MSFNVSPKLSLWVLTEQIPLTTTVRNGGIEITLYPQWYKEISVEWSVPPEFGRCLFNVYFSPVQEGQFNKLNSTPIDGTYLIDTTTREYSKNNKGYYVVEAILTDHGNNTLRSDPKTWENSQRTWVSIRSLEIQRREYWLLSRFVGVQSYLFRRKSYGARCKTCWNYELEKVMNDHCPDCLGTSFEGGYFAPAPLFIQYDANPNVLAKTYFGNYEPNQIGAWTISIPDIRPDDIIIRTGDWNMYKVNRVTPTELQTNTVRQMMTLTSLSKGDVEFQLVKRNLPDFPSEFTQ